jgi:hypothetical protein
VELKIDNQYDLKTSWASEKKYKGAEPVVGFAGLLEIDISHIALSYGGYLLVTIVIGIIIILLCVFSLWKQRSDYRPMSPFNGLIRILIKISPLLVVAVLIFLFYELGKWNGEQQGGEPFRFFEGVSVWPTSILRLITLFFAIWAIKLVFVRFKKNSAEMAELFQPKNLQADRGLTLWDFNPLNSWFFSKMSAWKAVSCKVNSWYLWRDYQSKCRNWPRIIRVSILSILYLACGRMLFVYFGEPDIPARSSLSYNMEAGLIFGTVLTLVFLVFLVVDMCLVSRKFFNILASSQIHWPDISSEGASRKHSTDESLRITDFMARHTRVIETMLYLPCIMLFLMIISRSSLFDDWDWPLSLIGVMFGSGVVLIISIIALRHAARDARRKIVQSLEYSRYAMAKEGESTPFIDRALGMIHKESRGAFCPLRETPLIRFILIPFAGFGSLPILSWIVDSLNNI